jgi:phosphate transport system substrate-binding protein
MQKWIKSFAVVLAGFSLATVAAAEQKVIVAAGATTVQPIVQQAGKLFKEKHPNVEFAVGAGGSDQGVETAGTGKVQLGMVGRALKPAELEKYKDLVPVTIGHDGIGILVHANNPLKKITKQQVQDIYSGKVTNWKDVGGPDAPIALASRTKGHAQLDLFASYFGLEANFDDESVGYKKKGDAQFPAVRAKPGVNNEKMFAAILENPNAISYIPIGFAQQRIGKGAPGRLLELDGVAADTKNVGDGTYPLVRPLLVITKGPAQGEVKEFIDFLISEAGRKIVSDLDYIPAQQPAAEPKKE